MSAQSPICSKSEFRIQTRDLGNSVLGRRSESPAYVKYPQKGKILAKLIYFELPLAFWKFLGCAQSSVVIILSYLQVSIPGFEPGTFHLLGSHGTTRPRRTCIVQAARLASVYSTTQIGIYSELIRISVGMFSERGVSYSVWPAHIGIVGIFLMTKQPRLLTERKSDFCSKVSSSETTRGNSELQAVEVRAHSVTRQHSDMTPTYRVTKFRTNSEFRNSSMLPSIRGPSLVRIQMIPT